VLERPARRALARRRAELGSYDVVCVEHAGLAPLVPARHENRWILTLHNLPSQMAVQAMALAPGRRQRWLLERERAKAVRMERRALETYDQVVVVSEEDAAALPGSVVVVPNGVDVETFRPTPLPPGRRVVLTAALYTRPNVEGVLWFAEEVWPRVLAAVPDAHLDVVGRRPTTEVGALGSISSIDVHADVETVVPYLQAARVAVVPVRIGTGTRLKALEAMAAGRPVVGTTIGLGGLGVENGRHALVADDADTMAAAVASALTDDGLAARLVDAASDLVDRRFRWDRIGERFTDLVVAPASIR
jgi:glycosyltransferase involved in cell wall biosynthesis